MADIFISYAREDRVRAEALAATLDRCGWSVWWDRHLRVGKEFPPEIERELQAARCVIVLWSRHSVGARWVSIEARMGLERGMLFPVFLEPVEPPLEFRWMHTAQFLDIDLLVQQLRAMLGGDGSRDGDARAASNHATILRSGTRAWNEWRAANRHIDPNLAGAQLTALDLAHANLAGANLANANLSLSVLEHSSFQNAILAGANLSETRLRDANFKEADLTRADVRRAVFENTILIGAKLAGAKHLGSTIHLHTSHIDDRALAASPGLDAHFLRGCGLTEKEIADYDRRHRR